MAEARAGPGDARGRAIRRVPAVPPGCNETLLGLLYDTGLRVGEVVQVDVEILRLDDDDAVYVPTQIQKDYPTDRTPPPRTMELGQDTATRDTVTRLRSYLTTRWRTHQRHSRLGRPTA